jgi:uncharacterized protein (TIGR00730 family)
MRKELAHDSLTELHVVNTMHERKQLMADLSDGFVALPGGFGTLEEFCEILTWAQLGLHAKPVGLVEVAGYYAPLVEFLDHAVVEGFVRAQHRGMLLCSESVESLLDAFADWRPRHVEKWVDRHTI